MLFWFEVIAILTMWSTKTVQALMEMGLWYTSLDFEADRDYAVFLSSMISADQWRFDLEPQDKALTAGLEFRVEANTSHIRIEQTAPASSEMPHSERMYIFFNDNSIANVTLLAPIELRPDRVTVELLPVDSYIEFYDVGFPFPLEVLLDDGALVIEFLNAQASTADAFPMVIQLAYE